MVDTDQAHAPGCFLLCLVDEKGKYCTRDERRTRLIQSDWDRPSIAVDFGWIGDPANIAAATAFLDAHRGNTIVNDPGYFNGDNDDE